MLSLKKSYFLSFVFWIFSQYRLLLLLITFYRLPSLLVFASLKRATIPIYVENLNDIFERCGMTDSDLLQEFWCCLAKHHTASDDKLHSWLILLFFFFSFLSFTWATLYPQQLSYLDILESSKGFVSTKHERFVLGLKDMELKIGLWNEQEWNTNPVSFINDLRFPTGLCLTYKLQSKSNKHILPFRFY